MNPIVVIPARMAATRLPGKPLAEIAGRPLIAHVVARALEAAVGPVIVATDSSEIAAAAKAAGADAMMTRDDHPSGSDRIAEAVEAADPKGRRDVVVNLQGDLPLIDPNALEAAVALLDEPETAIATLAAEIVEERERTDPNVVKAIGTPVAPRRLRALYFTRATAPHGPGPLYHHIGLYAYRREALSRFVALPQSALERREKLEQLRALEAGMRIDVAIVDAVPLGVDTPADLERVRAILEAERA
jgi:3-deoxy-manno-octulosonate cytidylyltransferase (CMP-KDO synthetase)